MPGSDTQSNQRCLEWLQRDATGRESQDRVPLYVLHVEEDSLTCGPFLQTEPLRALAVLTACQLQWKD